MTLVFFQCGSEWGDPCHTCTCDCEMTPTIYCKNQTCPDQYPCETPVREVGKCCATCPVHTTPSPLITATPTYHTTTEVVVTTSQHVTSVASTPITSETTSSIGSTSAMPPKTETTSIPITTTYKPIVTTSKICIKMISYIIWLK